jgi:hypothetical protein
MEELIFLESYWSRVKAIGVKIAEELPQIAEPKNIPSGKLGFVKYSELDDWNVERMVSGRSWPLEQLSGKVNHMIRKGNAEGIKRMIDKISTGRIKSLSKLGVSSYKKYLGRGHFRWNNSAITLTELELERVRTYFKYTNI